MKQWIGNVLCFLGFHCWREVRGDLTLTLYDCDRCGAEGVAHVIDSEIMETKNGEIEW